MCLKPHREAHKMQTKACVLKYNYKPHCIFYSDKELYEERLKEAAQTKSAKAYVFGEIPLEKYLLKERIYLVENF